MEIKDYLHLYLNSVDVIIESVSDEYKSHFGHAPGHKTQLGPMLWMIVFEGHVKIKPILRKLSDMTEEEGIKLVGHQSSVYTYVEKVAASNHCFRFSFEYTSSRRRREWTIDYNRLNPEQFTYLLKQGFDLFGLIPAGLAIDKTSLKN